VIVHHPLLFLTRLPLSFAIACSNVLNAGSEREERDGQVWQTAPSGSCESAGGQAPAEKKRKGKRGRFPVSACACVRRLDQKGR